MPKLNSKWLVPAALAALVLAGCGGGGGGGAVSVGNSTSALFNYVNGLIASSTDETSDPVDINSLTLAVDDTADPMPVN